ncbi:MAG: hypothetical protein Q8O48_08915 [Anaerolineales bacterium]|nr:hypothetical protein [Anaerolineales bacterium]
MLDSTVAMMKILFTLLIILIQETPVIISSPQAGETLSGQVEIIGNMDALNFMSAELAFSYAANLADTWFSIQAFPQPVAGTAIAIWDTASLTDGDYTLRLRVFFQDGSFQDVLISDLKIRNDAPLPAEIVPTETAFPQSTTTLPPLVLTGLPATAAITYPSPMPLPANPASVTRSSIYSTFARGALIPLVLFIFFSLLFRLRKN